MIREIDHLPRHTLGTVAHKTDLLVLLTVVLFFPGRSQLLLFIRGDISGSLADFFSRLLRILSRNYFLVCTFRFLLFIFLIHQDEIII